MHISNITAPLHPDLDTPAHNLVGLAALAAELAAEGVSVDELFARTGTDARQLEDQHARISHRQRLAIYRNARRIARRPDVGLLAGARQRISDFGIYGYAMLSSPTFGDALKFSVERVVMAGAVTEISYLEKSGTSILRGHGIESLGELLPFVSEFWRSSMTVLFSRVLESPFPSKRMVLSFPAPPHWRNYERMFNCPVEFGADSMEWHFDSSVLDRPCPNANPITAQICQQLCDRVLDERPQVPDLARRVRTACLNAAGNFPSAAGVAGRLGMSVRTLHRRLAADECSYQSILDDVRRSLAIEFLQNTDLPIEQIAERVGFSDAKSFRKSFKKWTGSAPTQYRQAT
ncbi:helix-turn-helix domain-containing protein [Paraburkholderia sp. CNPSo 3157]|uniref:Helix-turn-helix domain-containing protein n=1 Tax=Paraburkholderia franconis TaxID=2654983 RepID=A0A7X1NJE1_9BURK|nr:AraC family transcriptional regulator [Paraburkholderia franconis]MPW23073.1 helix-turn-helix domain-containing protein [Paraburkholderia franconis]